KSRALEYFRQVEKTGKPIVITDRGKPSLKLVPYSSDPAENLKLLRNTLIKYKLPFKPVGEEDWKSLK
ncbi:type II toxin-antitoxin system Phd/YefM family antitoxin, partial [bacterium]|nr:type II toxin-antitoxin system Phd/YefM family antitoxin [bacterium]